MRTAVGLFDNGLPEEDRKKVIELLERAQKGLRANSRTRYSNHPGRDAMAEIDRALTILKGEKRR